MVTIVTLIEADIYYPLVIFVVCTIETYLKANFVFDKW